jgi:nitrate reductase gamma subunit
VVDHRESRSTGVRFYHLSVLGARHRLWIIFPYAAITAFVVGHWWRYRTDRFGWTSGATQLFEHKISGAPRRAPTCSCTPCSSCSSGSSGSMTFAHNLITSSPYDYRDSVSLWWRSLFILQPNVDAVQSANGVYQVHAVVAWAFWALFPFSRLVHAWSIPLQYLGRPHILYRRRYATTSSRTPR